MALNLPKSSISALILDGNIAIAISAKEINNQAKAEQALDHYLALGYTLYAPGAIVTETLYILCQKAQQGLLSASDHLQAVEDFSILMSKVLPPPNGDSSLIRRAEEIRSGYGCSRSADGLYIALAEELSATMPTSLLTFDQDLPNQAARNAPSVTVHLLR